MKHQPPICLSMDPYPSKEGMAAGDKAPLTSHLSWRAMMG